MKLHISFLLLSTILIISATNGKPTPNFVFGFPGTVVAGWYNYPLGPYPHVTYSYPVYSTASDGVKLSWSAHWVA
ncbi:unnamed protein product [Tenebrio molitor]|nr:unnamed protein product [Tenebrio molitor]